MKQHICLLVLLLALSGCNENASTEKESNEKDGLVKNYREDGRLQSEIRLNEDGKKDGISKNYYKSTGKLQFEINYKNGVKHGLTKTFFEDGTTLYKSTQYQEGVKHGQEKLYYKNGQLMAEREYQYGKMGMGLKEYTSEGKEKTKSIPTILIKETNTLALNDLFVLEFSLSTKGKRVEFFQGVLTDGKYWNDLMDPIPTVKGKGRLEIYLPKGAFIMKELSIVAKVKTALRNYRIVTLNYQLAIDNKKL